MKRLSLLILLLAVCAPLAADPAIEVTTEGASLANAPLHLKINAIGVTPGKADVVLDGQVVRQIDLVAGEQSVTVDEVSPRSGQHTVEIRAGAISGKAGFRSIPGWLSIVPPLVAIVLALAFRHVVVALVTGIFAGALILYNWNPLT